MFEGQNHILAIATVIGTMGGFQQAPDWFKSLSKYTLWQILVGAILVYQGGGGGHFWYSLFVATVFYIVITLTKYISLESDGTGHTLQIGPSVPSQAPMQAPMQAPPSQEEGFTGYY